MEKPSPLDIPEILSLIASFVPLWEVLYRNRIMFLPRNLLSCTLVCRHWRQVMLPHLWAVYSARHMTGIPINVIQRNSPFFRYFYQDHARCLPISFFPEEYSRQPLLQCTALKCISFSSTPLSEEFDLIRANRGIISLDWWWPSDYWMQPGTLQNTLDSFVGSLKTLHIVGFRLAPELVSLLNHFSSLERIQMKNYPRPFSFTCLDDMTGMHGVRIQTLKELTIDDLIAYKDNVWALLSIFQQCPQIEYIVLHLHNSAHTRYWKSALQPLSLIHETVLTWKSRQGEPHRSMRGVADEICTAKAKSDTSDIVLPQGLKGLETLDMHLAGELYARFQNGCQDLVTLTASINMWDPPVVVPLIDSHRRTLRNVDLTCGSNMWGYTTFETLGRLVGSLPELRRLKFVAKGGLSREELTATFKGGLWLEDQDDGSTSVARTRTKGWACQHLERLAIRGMRATSNKDLLEKGQGAIILQSASENHQWVANDATGLDKCFRAVISERLQTVPALNELTLGSVSFYYTEILSESI